MRKAKRILSLVLCLAMVSAYFVGIAPSASAYSVEPYGPTVESVGTPSSTGSAISGTVGRSLYNASSLAMPLRRPRTWKST